MKTHKHPYGYCARNDVAFFKSRIMAGHNYLGIEASERVSVHKQEGSLIVIDKKVLVTVHTKEGSNVEKSRANQKQ